jgi:hypothetical protein
MCRARGMTSITLDCNNGWKGVHSKFLKLYVLVYWVHSVDKNTIS